jgi:hypothetical protein
MKGVDRADQCLLLLCCEENCKMAGKVVLYLLNCAFCNAFFCLQDAEYKQKRKVPDIPARGRKVLHIRSLESDELQLPEKQTTPRGPKEYPPGRLSGDFRIHKLEKIVGGGGRKKRSILQDSVQCVLYVRCDVKPDTFFNSALLRKVVKVNQHN